MNGQAHEEHGVELCDSGVEHLRDGPSSTGAAYQAVPQQHISSVLGEAYYSKQRSVVTKQPTILAHAGGKHRLHSRHALQAKGQNIQMFCRAPTPSVQFTDSG